MTWEYCWYAIRADLYRVAGRTDPRALLRHLVATPSTRYLVAFRLAAWSKGSAVRLPVWIVARWLHRRWGWRYGIEIPYVTEVGPGLKIAHRVGGVLVNPRAVLGSGVTLTPGVVVGGKANGSEAPTIGDYVIVHVGAKVIGPVSVGNGTDVGANAVVSRDVPAGSVVAGVPARVLDGSVPTGSKRVDFISVLGPIPER